VAEGIATREVKFTAKPVVCIKFPVKNSISGVIDMGSAFISELTGSLFVSHNVCRATRTRGNQEFVAL
jgi:hypothetical protein